VQRSSGDRLHVLEPREHRKGSFRSFSVPSMAKKQQAIRDEQQLDEV
jgi:hypothetical protein